MPFFGGANLAQLLQEAWGLAHTQATGRSLVEALDQFSQRLPAVASPGPLAGAGTRAAVAAAIPAGFDRRERIGAGRDGATEASTPHTQLGTARAERLRSLVIRLVSVRDEPARPGTGDVTVVSPLASSCAGPAASRPRSGSSPGWPRDLTMPIPGACCTGT